MTAGALHEVVRALLVQGKSPPAYWSFGHSLPFIGKDAPPPLGLATLATHLPGARRRRRRVAGRQPIKERHEDALNALDVLIDEDAQGTTRLEQPGHAATRSGIAAPQGHDTGRAPPGHRGCDASCAWRSRRTFRGRARAGRSAPSCRYGIRGDEAESAGLEDAGRPRAGLGAEGEEPAASMVTRQRSRSSRSTATR